MTSKKTLLLLLPLIFAESAAAVQLQDVVRLKGSEPSKLIGMGLVVGLAGTGDGGKYIALGRILTKTTQKFLDENAVPADVKDSKNAAVVYLEATIPAMGVQEGDVIDVYVSAVGKASSLRGGRLVMSPLTGPMKDSPLFAWAGGALTIEDSQTPTSAVVSKGAQMLERVSTQLTDEFGRITLVVADQVASWPVAHNIAALINGIMAPDGPDIARAQDPKNVLIDLPIDQRSSPGTFISQILRSYIDQAQIDTGARVLVNERTGQIMLGADVEISPVIISAPGITITTITPPPTRPDAERRAKTVNFLQLDPGDRGSAKLGQLMAALEQLKVPASDRISIIKDLHKHGSLTAQLIIE